MYLFKRKAILIIALIFSCTLNTFSQENNPLINSGEVILNGTKLHEENRYKQAIHEYNKVSRSDTNYYTALYELSYSHYADSQFDRSLEYAKQGLKLFPERYTLFSMLAANSLDELKRHDEALAIYDSALIRTPNAYLLHFNKGIVNYNLKKYEDAKKNMQASLMINPFYSPSHYFLANMYMFQGKLVPALLAYKTYLLIAPEGKYYVNAISAMSNIGKVTDDILEYVKNKPTIKEDEYPMQQDILLSKASLDRQYKLKADLEDNLVRQIQVVDEKLEYIRNDKSFSMQFYVPFYENVMKLGQFEPMVFTAFSGVDSKPIQNWIKKNKKERQEFIETASTYFDAIKGSKELDATKREGASIQHVYDTKGLLARGAYTKGKDMHAVGKWEYYYENGAYKAKGAFNEAGEKEGQWIYYYDNGQVKEKVKNSNGMLDGLAEGWFDNGRKWYTETYTNGKLNGTQTIYYYNGNLRSVAILKDDKKAGEQKLYDTKGQLTSIVNYSDDNPDGWSRMYYPNGKIKSELQYKSQKEEGTYKSYYDNGKLYLQGDFKNGQRQGLWTTYFNDGIVSEKTVYLDNEITGEFTEYYATGELYKKGTYYKKNIDGKLEVYDDDGKLYSEYVYDKGKLKESNFLDKSGKVISTSTTRKGAGNITFYTPEGIRASEGFFNKEGNKDGKFTYFYTSGKPSEESNWKDGVQQGEERSYFPDGKLKRVVTYKDGEESGYVKEFHANGKISNEGWKVDGSRQQNYLFYNKVGDMTTREYFLDEELDGYTEYYNPGNKKSSESIYRKGWIIGNTQFDTTGKVLRENRFPNGDGAVIYHNVKGTKSAEGTYKSYMLNGPYTFYFYDGSLSATSFYKNEQLDSNYKVYYYGGVVRTEGKFRNGLKEGVWKYYYTDGKLKDEEHYVAGKLQGQNKMYMKDGTLDKIANYKDGELHGPYEIYGEKNQLAVRFNYKYDVIKSYQFEEKAGALSAPVLLKGGSGNVSAKYPNGKPSAVMTFVDNNVEGERKIYYTNGNVYSEGNRLYGFQDGLIKWFYPDGKIWKEENFVLGEYHGISKAYFPTGKIEREEFYYDGDAHGTLKVYDEAGKIKTTRIYYYGTLLSNK